MVCSGAKGGQDENNGNFGSGSAIGASIVAEMGKDDVAVECVSPRFMNLRVKVKGKANGLSI